MKLENDSKNINKQKKIIYVTGELEELTSGVTKKIYSQCFALYNLGFQVYLFINRIDRCVGYEVNNGQMIEIFYKKYSYPFATSFFRRKNIVKIFQKKYHAYIRIREFFENLYEMDLLKKFEVIYIRRIVPTTNILIKYLKQSKRDGKKIIYEYPTYPWEREILKSKHYFIYILDKIYFQKLVSLLDYVTVILGKKMNLPEKFITISNGINIKSINKKKKNSRKNGEFHMIGLAKVQYWQGYDRIIKGIAIHNNNLYKKERAYFHIIGNGNSIFELKELTKRSGLEKYIFFHGAKAGKDLDEFFDLCQVGIGSLGAHRKGMSIASPLKNREYCARGIPFIISVNDLDFPEDFPFTKRIPADDSEVNIEEIIDYYTNLKVKFPNCINDMRNYAEKYLSWENKLKPVVDVILK